MNQNIEAVRYNLREEIANAVTHGIGSLLAIAGLIIMLVLAHDTHFLGFLIYGVTLVVLYLASTMYHALSHLKIRHLFRKFDHMAIFCLIAGTYTPYCLNVLDGSLQWIMLTVIWSFAGIGMVLKYFFVGRLEWLSLTMYVAMGWMVLLVIKPIYDSLSHSGFLFLLIGGFSYTVGTIFYVNTRLRFSHSIWHVWVLAGSIFHFFSVMTLL